MKVLVDGGAHTISSKRIVKFLGLPFSIPTNFKLSWKIDTSFIVTTYVMKSHQHFTTLKIFQTSISYLLTMLIQHYGSNGLKQTRANSYSKLTTKFIWQEPLQVTNSISAFYHLHLTSLEDYTCPDPSTIPSSVVPLIQYTTFFSKTHKLYPPKDQKS